MRWNILVAKKDAATIWRPRLFPLDDQILFDFQRTAQLFDGPFNMLDGNSFLMRNMVTQFGNHFERQFQLVVGLDLDLSWSGSQSGLVLHFLCGIHQFLVAKKGGQFVDRQLYLLSSSRPMTVVTVPII